MAKYLGSQRSRTDSMGGQPFGLNRGQTRTTYDAAYQPAFGDLMLPLGMATIGVLPTTFTVIPTINKAQAVRFVVPKTGVIKDISFFQGATAAANYDIGIYDTGDTTPAVRTRLFSSGSTSVGATTNAWVSTACTVSVRAGQHIDAALVCSEATTNTFGRIGVMPNTAIAVLPTGYLGSTFVASASPKLNWGATSSLPLPTTIAEASCTATTYTPFIIMRIQ